MATADFLAPLLSGVRQRPQDIIDVDALDDETMTILGTASQFQDSRVPEGSRSAFQNAAAGPSSTSIIVVDSSEDEDVSSVNGTANVRPQRVRPRARPRPPHVVSLVQLTANAANNAPPPIVPSAQPFPFEAQIQQPVRRANSPPLYLPPPAAAPRSQHQPIMGLGGGLIALNRQNVIDEANRRQREAEAHARQHGPHNIWHNLNIAGMWRNGILGGGYHLPGLWHASDDNGQYDPGDLYGLDLFGDVLDGLFQRNRAFGARGTQGRSAGPSDPLYKPTYTHPETAPAGFTFDFSPPDAPSSTRAPAVIVLDDDDTAAVAHNSKTSSTAVETTTTLVCARCMDPLILSTNGAASEDKRKARKVWALRCGHMLDGKCIAELMRPRPPPPPPFAQEIEAEVPGFKGKGKGRAMPVVEARPAEGEETPVVSSVADEDQGQVLGKRNRTGDRKGKAKALDVPTIPIPSASPTSPVETEPADTSMRSRLRPRPPRGQPTTVRGSANASAAASALGSATSPVAARPTQARRGRAPARPRGPAKGKGRAKKPAIEAEHLWACPIAGCSRPHKSVCTDGEWKMDDQMGCHRSFRLA